MDAERTKAVLELLRDIGANLLEQRGAFDRIDRRRRAIIGHVEDVKALVARGEGIPVRPLAAFLPIKQRLDRLADRLDRRESRVAVLEQRE